MAELLYEHRVEELKKTDAFQDRLRERIRAMMMQTIGTRLHGNDSKEQQVKHQGSGDGQWNNASADIETTQKRSGGIEDENDDGNDADDEPQQEAAVEELEQVAEAVRGVEQASDEEEEDMIGGLADADMFQTEFDKALEDGVRVGHVENQLGAADKRGKHDDEHGYYVMAKDETIGDRFRIVQARKLLGKGSFSTVVRAKDLRMGETVAVKVIRNYGDMYQRAIKEANILNKIREQDPDNHKCIVRFISKIEHKSHMCLVFENMHQNLREFTRKNRGSVDLYMIQRFSRHLLLSLDQLRNMDLIHADIKPDNVLVSVDKRQVKLADLGTAFYTYEPEETDLLGSRWYRSPEVILGMKYDCAIDMWGLGCTIFELFSGRPLFRGKDNHEMLHLFCKFRGRLPRKLLRKGEYASRHFDDEGRIAEYYKDPISKKQLVRYTMMSHQRGEFERVLLDSRSLQPKDNIPKILQSFLDMLSRMLELDPAKRIKPGEALRHPFIVNTW
eukprot:CAMPEP_0184504548 /NCGR_PEP_ID=MMETSP0113_2-20130426/52524_1 /TAXON_ID=91329 /ORGANISM="Norrisiella sphaerica, Strain BC52" /LENGTH=501 /DNA_ID=CAMNT_0026894199 /DNA_START=334 /DNA_END=1836 /DNA_ORIENTATION=-